MQYLCSTDDLDVEHTVSSGQCFRWSKEENGEWSCFFQSADTDTQPVLIYVTVQENGIYYRSEPEHDTSYIRSYFRLNIDLKNLTEKFITTDPNIAPAIAAFPGLRVLRQDPVECLFSFICSSAAPLHRIRRNITQLCRYYGDSFAADSRQTYYAFPTIEAIAEANQDQLYGFGLGYRAKFLKQASREVLKYGGAPWLHSLRSTKYDQAKQALMSLPGVGAKIADCVCLFSLDHDEAIPVDTHIRQIAERHYINETTGKSLTTAIYNQIGNTLRERFGEMAGWAQQYLFFEDLYEKRAWGAYQAQMGRDHLH